MVQPVGSHGPQVPLPPLAKAQPAAALDVEQAGRAQGAAGNKHGGAPGQLAKALLDGTRPPEFSLGTLVSLIAQGHSEEAQALADSVNASTAETTAEKTTQTAASDSTVPVTEENTEGGLIEALERDGETENTTTTPVILTDSASELLDLLDDEADTTGVEVSA